MTAHELLDNAKIWCSHIPQRYVFALMCFFGLFNAFAMRSCLPIAITEMVVSSSQTAFVDEKTCTYEEVVSHDNGSIREGNINYRNTAKGTYNWSQYTQGLILSSFYWGYIITHLPAAFIAKKYGGKHTLGFGIIITATLTILVPVAVYIGESTALIVLRIFMGVGEGITLPATNVLLSNWVPPEERSRTASFVYGSTLIGMIFATTVSGWILQYSSIGWPLVFYVMGILGVIWYLIWLILCYDSPQVHPFITEDERNYLNERMSEHKHEQTPAVPLHHILRSKPVWATAIGMMGFGWLNLKMLTYLPKYMNGVLKFSAENNGYYTSLVYLCTWIGSSVGSWLIDYLISKRNMSTTLMRKVGCFMALPVSAAFYVGASYAGCDRVLVVGMFVVAMALMGCAYPTVVTNPLDLSPNYTGTVTGFANGAAVFSGIVALYMIGVITPNQTLDEWRLGFWIMFGVTCICSIIFLVCGSGEVQYWNDPEFLQKEIDKNNKRKTSQSQNI